MRNFLTARWRRYAVAFVVAAASLGAVAACNPNKKPAPPPPPPDNLCGITSGACLTIFPLQWVFHSFGETKTFTVKNNGPDTSQPVRVAIFGGNIDETRLSLEWRLFQDNCSGKSLIRGDSCTVGVESTHVADNATSQTNLNVSSANSQPGGDAVPLSAGCDARLEPQLCP
jgi:hypothetical protein